MRGCGALDAKKNNNCEYISKRPQVRCHEQCNFTECNEKSFTFVNSVTTRYSNLNFLWIQIIFIYNFL